MVVIVPTDAAGAVQDAFNALGEHAYRIGEVIETNRATPVVVNL
jgi:phosphoribosylaminoimidazole (AIR) synthetase